MIENQKFSRRQFETSLVFKALKDRAFRKRLITNPTKTYQEEAGHPIPSGVEIRVIEEQPDVFFLVIPYVPVNEDLTEEQLLAVAGRELTHREPCWGIGDGLDRCLPPDTLRLLSQSLDSRHEA